MRGVGASVLVAVTVFDARGSCSMALAHGQDATLLLFLGIYSYILSAYHYPFG